MIRNKVKNLKQGLKDKGKARVGIMIHKKIGDLFEWDDQVIKLTDQVIKEYKNGDKDKAVLTSEKLEHYLKARMNRETRYRQRAQELGDQLEGYSDKLESIKEDLDDSRFEDLLDGALDPESISEDVDEELINEIYEDDKQ